MGIVEPAPRTSSSQLERSAQVRRAAARDQAARFVLELQRRARHARTRRRTPLLKAPDFSAIAQTFSVANLARPLALSAIVVVVIPSLIATIYFGLIASNVYEAEARFAVRTGAVSGIDAMTSFAGIPSITQVQDSLIVTNFVLSRAAVEVLESSVGLRDRYSRNSIDFFSRLASDDPTEDVVKFWQKHVSVAIESPSGIITVRVRAFSPKDALALADGLVATSEQLVNRLGAQARNDLVTNSERELQGIEDRLSAARERLNQLRISEGIIDPQLTAQGINMLITELRGEAVRLGQEITTLQRVVSQNAPQMQPLRTRLAAIREQTEALQNELTLRRDKGRDGLSAVMTRFDQLALERQVLERQYASAAASLEQARTAAARQQMYLATFVRPVLPEDPVGPRRILYPVLITLGLLIAWGIGVSMISRRRAQAG